MLGYQARTPGLTCERAIAFKPVTVIVGHSVDYRALIHAGVNCRPGAS